MARKFNKVFLMVVLSLGLSACSDKELSAGTQTEPNPMVEEAHNIPETFTSDEAEPTEVIGQQEDEEAGRSEMDMETESIEEEVMKIKVTAGDYVIVFALNDTSAAVSLYEQLPLTVAVENYSNNEKIFYADKLDCTNVIEGDCPVGTLAYFSPWGNVVMYYGAASQYPGLYILGEAVEGVENISSLTGEITITKAEAEEVQ